MQCADAMRVPATAHGSRAGDRRVTGSVRSFALSLDAQPAGCANGKDHDMRKLTKLVALCCLLGAIMAGCEVPDPQPGAALYEKTPSLPVLPTVDWDWFGDADGIEQHQYDPQNNLWLNIYKARLPAGVSSPKGIAFYVHGGAFTIG